MSFDDASAPEADLDRGLIALLEAKTSAGGGIVTNVTATAPIASSGGPTPNISHQASGVAAGAYTNASVTVNADGHVTAAASGTAPVTTVSATPPLAVSGGLTPTVAYDAATGSGLQHVTAGAGDVAAIHGAAPGQVPVTNAGVTDVAFGFIFGTWVATVDHAASPFVPAAGQIMIPVDTSGGIVVVDTPAAPVDGQLFIVKPVAASATPITVTAVGGATIEDPTNPCTFGASGSVPGQGSGAWWKYQATGTRWIMLPGSGV